LTKLQRGARIFVAVIAIVSFAIADDRHVVMVDAGDSACPDKALIEDAEKFWEHWVF